MAVNRTSKAKGKVLDIPNTPTIGTASDNGAVGATVTFTAADKGGPSLSYTVISNPGSITSTGSTSPITVSGLSANTTYTFTVSATNPSGTSSYSSASNSVTPAPLDYGAMFPIRSYVVPSGGVADFTFSSIPSTYTHLQIRMFATDTSTGGGNWYAQINSDTGSNYAFHRLRGDGSSVIAQSGASDTSMNIGTFYEGTSIYGTFIIDILDYANTNKYKVIRSLGGGDANGNGFVTFGSGLWTNTNAITSIKLYTGSTIAQYSSFALYGVKA